MHDDNRLTAVNNAKIVCWRLVCERSSMINNDEVVMYIESENITTLDDIDFDKFEDLTWNEVYRQFKWKLTILRPVFDFETVGKDKLNITFNVFIEKHKEKLSTLSRLLDEFWKLMSLIKSYNKCRVEEYRTFEHMIVHIIAYNYYDCMSSGCPAALCSILRYAIIKGNLNLNTYVYPASEDSTHATGFSEKEGKFYNLGDFLGEFDSSKDKYFAMIEQMALLKLLPGK